MNQINGEITEYLSVIGKPENSSEFTRLKQFIGEKPSISEDDLVGYERSLGFKNSGLEFTFGSTYDDPSILLRVVFIFLSPHDNYNAYKPRTPFIEGLASQATPKEVHELLGSPIHSNDELGWELYQIDGRFANFTYDHNKNLVMVTLMSEDPNHDSKKEEVYSEGEIISPEGYIKTFSVLMGIKPSKSSMNWIMAEETGYELEEKVVEQDDEIWRYTSYSNGGVDITYRNDVVVAVRFHLIRNKGSVYSGRSYLLSKIEMPASREHVINQFGIPIKNNSIDSSDTYNIVPKGIFEGLQAALKFEYNDDLLARVVMFVRNINDANFFLED